MENEHLINGKVYHIYNRGNNKRDLFAETADYEHFLSLYDRFVTPVAETFAWVLMPNHFHFLVRIKENILYKYSKHDRQTNSVVNRLEKEDSQWFREHKWETVRVSDSPDSGHTKKPVPHRHFSHLFNAYTRYFNTRTGGTGNLFERPFKRKEVKNEIYMKKLMVYIHNNPVHHGFCEHPLEYPWSSYLSITSNKQTKLNRKAVIEMFQDKQVFEDAHHQDVETNGIENWLNLNPSDYVTENTKENNPVNADISHDDIRLEADEQSENLSACATPDNVKRKLVSVRRT